MNKIYKYVVRFTFALVGVASFSLTSCSDDMPESSYYTFTGEMLSDWLKNREDFSKFTQIVEKSGRMDLLATYGTYTCFAPTNDAIDAYLASKGLTSIDQLSKEDCDTITCTALINDVIYTTDLSELVRSTPAGQSAQLGTENFLGRTLTIDTMSVEVGGEMVETYTINGSSVIIYGMANDSVENGIVHPVIGNVISSTNKVLPAILKADPSISIFYTALTLTGLDQEMQRIEDRDYDPKVWREGEKNLEGKYYTGAQWDLCRVPDTRRFGYTAFVVPDSILKDYSTIAGWTKDINSWEDLYDYACEKYPEGAGQSYYGKDEAALKDERNPLHKLIAYHLMDRKAIYSRLYSNCSIYRNDINPTEWYTTMNPHSMLKLEYVYGSNRYLGNSTKNQMYLNRIYDPDRNIDRRGAIVSVPSNNDALNGYYYYLDRLIDYGQDTRETVFNARMRIDFYHLFPEMMNNDLRAQNDKTGGQGGDTEDELPKTNARNYIFPPGYFENVISSEGNFIFQNCRNYFWSYEGDEFNLLDKENYDITFKLPSVPSGTYQIRLGFTAMAHRGIAQFYIDGIPQDIPLDMRKQTNEGFAAKTGWKSWGSLKSNPDALEQCKKDMHNKGWYHAPAGVRYVSTGARSLLNDNLLGPGNSERFSDGNGMIRKVIFTGYLDGNTTHTMRIKSVLALGSAELMLDYLEFVPKDVYGIEGGGKGEDDY